jgi:hypothetical protein
MSHKVPLVRVLTAATGNSTPIILGAAYSQLFMLPSEAGAMDGRTYTYNIVDGNNWEIGRGVYTASGTTLARTTILASRISGTLGTSRISLSGTAQVRFIETADDMDGVRGTRAVTGTTDTLNNSDLGYVVTYSNASAVAVSLAQTSVSNLFTDGWAVLVKNKGAGAVTITPSTSTIDGAATLVLAQNQGALIWSDGANYQSFAFRGDIGVPVRADAAQSLNSTQQNQVRSNLATVMGTAGPLGDRNLLINGRFKVDQMRNGVASTLASNSYGPDMWRGLIESGNITMYARWPAFAQMGAVFQSNSSNNLKFGAFQVIEGINVKGYRSLPLVLSAAMLVSDARVGNIKMAILEYTGTEDAVSGNPVSSWGADGVTPTLATNWAFLNTPANLSVTTTVATYQVTGTVGASMNNLGVLIWNDDKTNTLGDNFSITDVQLEVGTVATPYQSRQYGVEVALCQRYWASTFDIGTVPGNNVGSNGTFMLGAISSGNYEPSVRWQFPVVMRVIPTVTLYNPAGGTGGQWGDGLGGAGGNARAINISTQAAAIDNTDVTLTGASSWRIHATADARL